jgi:hypothetical protein
MAKIAWARIAEGDLQSRDSESPSETREDAFRKGDNQC